MPLPIRQLTLYKHGIGVVVRGGAVSGTSATLTFHKEQMNDVLKSLVAWDRGGGQVRNVAYDAPEEREQKLERGSIHLSERNTLLDLLRDLRGRAVRVRTEEGESEQTWTGTVVGLDANESFPFAQGRLSLLTDAGVVVLRLHQIVAVEALDEQARADLGFFLRASVAEPDQRTVTLNLTEGEHDLVVRYLAPSPTWRVSYRLVGEREEGGERRALLQGWGIFDNPFDEPLEEVRVTLVAGMPISFVYDLYTPFTPDRPVVQEESRVAAAPIEMERGKRMTQEAMAPRAMMRTAAMAAPMAAPMQEMDEAEAMDFGGGREALSASTMVAAQGEAQGDLFEYRLQHPVTVQRGEAAMVPILATEVPYRKEHIYNGQKMRRHPTAVLRFRNETELTLERGPITVVEDDAYSGEAIFPFSRPNAEVLLAIAVDLGVSVREERTTSRETHAITLERSALIFHEYTTVQTVYEVSNTNPEAVTLLVEHPRNTSFQPLGMAEPEETTENHYRWKVEVPVGPEGQTAFTVRERRQDRRQEQLSSLTEENLRHYLRNRWLDEALANELRGLLGLYAERQRLQRRVAEIEQERARLTAAQEQARKNMSGLKDTGDEGALRARYVRQLNESEDALAKLEAERGTLKADEAALEQRIRETIAALK
ncbi:MAG TPA: hypothetical protein VF707_11075 [Ardenticatenaceae bacterium]|jgi:hypothetical protein